MISQLPKGSPPFRFTYLLTCFILFPHSVCGNLVGWAFAGKSRIQHKPNSYDILFNMSSFFEKQKKTYQAMYLTS